MATADQAMTRQEFYEAILPSLPTKEDLAKLEARLIKWMVVSQLLGLTAAAAIVAAVAAVMRLVG